MDFGGSIWTKKSPKPSIHAGLRAILAKENPHKAGVLEEREGFEPEVPRINPLQKYVFPNPSSGPLRSPERHPL